MSTMRYVGARYVPKWYVNSVDQTANWEINVEYEPLTWVTTPNNHLYLSKKTVPDNIGTPAQNTAYWLDMGEMTGDLQNIQDQINAITANIGDLNDLITSDTSSLVAAINEAYNHGGSSTPERKYILLGDSFSRDSHSYVALMQQMLGNDHVYAYDWSIIQPPGFASQLQFKVMLESIIGVNDDEITDIVCIGGTNDLPYVSTVATKIDEFCTYAYGRFKNAKISIGYLTMGRDYKGQGLAQIYRDGAVRNGCTYLNGLGNLMCDPQYLSGDSVHPTSAGYTFYAPYVVQAIINGHADYDFTFVLPLTLGSGFSASPLGADGTLRVQVTDKGVTIRFTFSPIVAYVGHGTTDITSGVTLFSLSNFPLIIFDPILYRSFGKIPRVVLGNYYGAYNVAMKSVTEIGLYGAPDSGVVGQPGSGVGRWYEFDSSVNMFVDSSF